jgi:uncharacterized protein (DUF1330 family)
MAKGYWIAFYRSIFNAAALAECAKLASPAIEAGGGKFLGRGIPAKAYEAGRPERTVLIEFESVAKAISTYESDRYQTAAKLLHGAVVREIRIIEGA